LSGIWKSLCFGGKNSDYFRKKKATFARERAKNNCFKCGKFLSDKCRFLHEKTKNGGLARRGRGDNSAEKGGLGGTDVPPGCNDTTALTC
jgi:hypothetical protein